MPSQDEPCEGEPAWPGLLAFDYQAAEAEGWTIAEFGPRLDGTPTVVLMHLDTPAARERGLLADQDVRRHVTERAEAGSALHRQALALVDAAERFVAVVQYGKPSPAD